MDLIETLPPKDETSPEDLVPAFQSTDGLLVAATRSALESQGIPVVVQGEEAQGLLPVNAVVLVPRRRLRDAQDVIQLLEARPESDSPQ
ncbi:MAG: hypothetical protein E2P04_01615 [Acidobacteria bacterium]|nr:MAG: hypothetical protein E2P04_01615 [Acidobacteriota bacterium]